MKAIVKRVQTPAAAIPIQTETIQLDAFLKLANAVESGGRAKLEIQSGRVLVNGAVCTQRGKRLRPGDTISFLHKNYKVNLEHSTAT